MSFFPVPTEKVVKITAFAYKKPGVTTEYFLKHWRETHVEKFIKNPKAASKLLGYVQCHRDEALSKQMEAWPMADYDGYAEFYVRTMEDWIEIASEPQHLAETMPDMDYFCDSARMTLLITDFEPRFWEIPLPSVKK